MESATRRKSPTVCSNQSLFLSPLFVTKTLHTVLPRPCLLHTSHIPLSGRVCLYIMGENGKVEDPDDPVSGLSSAKGTSAAVNEEVVVPEDLEQPSTTCVSHFRNEEVHSIYVRYGVPLFLLCALVLLINADVGSGVSAEYLLLRDGEIEEQQELLVASIFSSVKELWHNGSYPLAILIVITSIMWPYIKLGISFYIWFVPYERPRRRELMIEIVDAVGKWSFVDIVVLVEIMVAFRSSIKLAANVTLEVVILAKWGFYGFVIATMMSLVATHFILHLHRKVHYHAATTDVSVDHKRVSLKERGGLSSRFIVVALTACVASFVCFLVACLLDIYRVENSRGDINIVVDYSIVSVGKSIPDSQLEPNDVGTRFLQVMWFFLCVLMPLWVTFLFGILYAFPLSRTWAERIFVMGEIAFAWSCAEVLLVSTIFAVLQMPTFGDGLIEADCSACFVVDTQLLGGFGMLCVGSIVSVTVNVWLYRKAHGIIYGSP